MFNGSKMSVSSFFGESLSDVIFARKPKVDKIEELAETILNSSKFIATEERRNIIGQLVSNRFNVDAINFTRFRNRLKDGLWVLWRKGWLYGEEDVRDVYFSESDSNYIAEFNNPLEELKELLRSAKIAKRENEQSIREMSKSLGEAEKSITSLQSRIMAASEKGNTDIINDLTKQLRRNNLLVEDLKSQIDDLRGENKGLLSRISVLNGNIKSAEKEIQETTKTARIQELETALKKLKEKQQDPKNKLNLSLTKQIKEKSEELDKLQREKATTKRAVRMSEDVVEIVDEVDGEKVKRMNKISDELLQKRINDKIKRRQNLSVDKVAKLKGEVLETPVDLRQKRLDLTSAKIAETEQQVEALSASGDQSVNVKSKPLFKYKELKDKIRSKQPLTIEEQTFYDVEKEFRLNLTDYNSTQDEDGKITKIATAFEKYEGLKKKNPQGLTDTEQQLIDIVEDYREGLKSIEGSNATTNLDVAQKRLDHLKRKKSLLEKEALPEKFYKEVVKTRLEQTAQTSKNVDAGINYYIDQSDFGRVYLEKRLEYLAKSYEEQEKKHILKRMAQVFQLGTGEDEIIIGEDGKVKNKTLQTKIQEYFEQNRLTYFPNTGEMRGFGDNYNVLGAEGLVAGKRQVFDSEGNLSEKRAIPALNKFRPGGGNYYKDLGTIGKKQKSFISREARLIDYYRDLIYGEAPKTAENILNREKGRKDSEPIELKPEEQKALGLVSKDTITVKTLKRYVGQRKTTREYIDKKGVRQKYNVIDGVDVKKEVLDNILKKYNITTDKKKDEKLQITSAEARSLGVTNRNLSYNALRRHVDGLQMDYFSGKAARIVRTELAAANHLGRLNYIVENDDIGLVRWVVDKEHIFRRAVCERINKKDVIFKNSVITHGMGCVGRSLGQSIGVGKKLSGIYRTVDVLTQPTLMIPLHPYCMCEVRPLKKNELDGVLLGVTGKPTLSQLQKVGAGTVTAATIASRDAIAEEENAGNPLGTFLTISAGVILTTVAAIYAYKMAFSNKQVAQKIIKEVDDNIPRKTTSIDAPKLPVANRQDLQKAVKDSLVIDEMLKDTQLPEQTPLKIPLPVLENNRELVELQLSTFRHAQESAEALKYGVAHYDELSDQTKRSLLNIDLPERLNVSSELEDYVKPQKSYLEQVLEEGRVAKVKLETDMRQGIVLLPPPNRKEIEAVEKQIKEFVDEKGRGYRYYDNWIKRINEKYEGLYADLPTRKDVTTYTKQQQRELTKRLKDFEKQVERFDNSFFKKMDIENFDLTAYLETLEADGADLTPNMRKFIENRGFLQANIIGDDLITMSQNAKYINKIKLPNYKSLFKPDGKRKVSNLTMEGLENKEDVLREIQTLINDENKNLNKKQIKYLAKKYNTTTLNDFVQSKRLKPTEEERVKINTLLQEEIKHIKNAEFSRYQKKWAMFGSPR